MANDPADKFFRTERNRGLGQSFGILFFERLLQQFCCSKSICIVNFRGRTQLLQHLNGVGSDFQRVNELFRLVSLLDIRQRYILGRFNFYSHAG